MGKKNQRFKELRWTELCHLGEAEVTTSSESYKCSLQKTQVKQKSSEKPPAPQSNEAEFCFTFHYFWVGDYPNLHKLVWYSGMTGHVVASKCSIASCIHWPCSSPAPSVRIASDSKHQPRRFLSLYCCDKNTLPLFTTYSKHIQLSVSYQYRNYMKSWNTFFPYRKRTHLYSKSWMPSLFFPLSPLFFLFSSSPLLHNQHSFYDLSWRCSS